MAIRISSKRDGFRRCGIAHPADRTWPAGLIPDDVLAILKAEPMLVVQEIDDQVDALLVEAGHLTIEAMAGLRRQILGGNHEDTPTQPAADAEGQQAQPEAGVVVMPSGGAAATTEDVQPAPSDPGSDPVPTEAGEASGADPAKAPDAAPPKKPRKG